MAVKILCISTHNIDPEALGSLYCELKKLPVLIKHDRKREELVLTCNERYIVAVEKAVAKYV